MRRINLAFVVATSLLGACAGQKPTSNQIAALPDTNAGATINAIAISSTATEPPQSVNGETTEANQAINKVHPDQDFWQHLRSGMGFSHAQPIDKYRRQLDWYSANQSYLDRALHRGSKYLYYITSALESNQLPMELSLLPMVESAYDPFAYSPSQASGLWQFIPSTGKRFGLNRDWWYDGRRDIIDSTRAAIEYLKSLRDDFDGDWLLALAAYNSGEGTIMRAIERNRRQGKPTDFWSLRLPRETRAYVPQLLAISEIISHPDKYGVSLPEIAYQPYFKTIRLPSQLDLAQAARMAASNTEELYELNPGLRRWLTPKGVNRLNVPVKKVHRFQTNLAATPRKLWVPVREYLVKRGDSLSTIARRQNIDIAMLKSHNHLSSDLIRVGQVLRIPGRDVDLPSLAHGEDGTVYQVKGGESLWEIAHRHGMKTQQLARLNDMTERTIIHPGQVLKVSTSQSIQHSIRPLIRKMNYRVRRGDSLSRIAHQFDVRVQDILQWNKLNRRHYLQPGQKLTLFIDVR